MAKNPKFNNDNMFPQDNIPGYGNVSDNASNSEVLATRGNVINSLRTFWDRLREKLAYAISRPDYNNPVGGNYVPIFVNADGVAQECQPTTVTAGIAGSGIITIPADTIPNENIYTGTTVCINVSNNSASSSDNSLQIQHNNDAALVKYPSGVTVLAKDISGGDLLLATFCKTGSTNFWILLNKINTVVSKAINGGYSGLMSAADKEKLDGIQNGANAYELPAATDSSLGGVRIGYTANGKNYAVQKDSNDKLYVNVPWTDTDTHNTASIAMSVDKSDAPNITLTNSDDSGSSSIQVVGSGGTQVAVGQEGQLVIDSQPSVIYNNLLTDGLSEQTPVTVPYPSTGRRKATRFLNGLGEWVTSTDKLYAGQDLTITNDGALGINANILTGTLTIYNAAGERVPCAFLIVKSDNTTDVVSSGYGTLNFANYSVNLPLYGVKYIPYFPINDETNYQTQYMPGVVKISRPTSSSIKYNVL